MNFSSKSLRKGNWIVLLVTFMFVLLFFVLLLCNRQLTFRNILGAAILGAILFGVLLFSVQKSFQYTQGNLVSRLLYSICIVYSVAVLWISFMYPTLAWDTHQMYDMSKYVFTDFGYMVQIRQHIENTHYEMAFPPLFPVLMASLNFIFDTGINSSVYIGSICAILTVPVLGKIGYEINKQKTMAVTTFLILCGTEYCTTVRWGLCQNLNFLFLACIINLLLTSKMDMRTICCLAVLAAAGLMTRFDFLAIVVAVFISILYLSYGKVTFQRLVSNAAVYGMLLVSGSMPWIVYSYKHFGKLFVTDNGRRLINIPDTRPSTFFSQSQPAETIRDDFWRWLQAISQRMKTTIVWEIKGIQMNTLIGEICMLCIVLLVILVVYKDREERGFLKEPLTQVVSFLITKRNVVSVFLCILAQEALFMLTGYEDTRYHLPLYFLLQFLCLDFLFFLFSKTAHSIRIRKMQQRGAIILMLICLLGFNKIGYRVNPLTAIRHIANGGYTTEMYLNHEEMKIKQIIEKDCSCICLYRDENELDIGRFSALSEIPSMISPNNISEENVKDFVNTFKVNYIYSSNKELVQIFESQYQMSSAGSENLYRIEEYK